MGQDIEGVLIYDAAGHMAAQIMRYARPRFTSGDMESATPAELSAAALGYTAYFGTYRVEDSAAVVTHYVKGSLFPNWVGTEQQRGIVLDDDHLTLTSPPILSGGGSESFGPSGGADSSQPPIDHRESPGAPRMRDEVIGILILWRAR